MGLFKENLDELLNSTKTITIKGKNIGCENLNIVVTYPEYLDDGTMKQSINKLLTMLKNGHCDAINKMINSESEIIHDQLSLLMSIVLYSNNAEVSLSYFSNKNPHMHVITVSAKLMGDDSVSIELGDYQHIKVLFMKPLKNLINEYVLLVHTVLNSLFILSGKSILNNSVFSRLNKKVLTELAQISYLSPNIYKEYYITLNTDNVSVKSYTFGLVDNVKMVKTKNNSVIVKPITLKSIIVRSDADWEIFSHINTITKQKINRFKIVKSRPLPLSADLMNQIIQVILTKPDDSFNGRVFNKDNINIIVYTKQSVRSADMKKLQEKLTSVANKVFNLIKQAGFDDDTQVYVELPDNSRYIGVKLFDPVTNTKVNFAVVNKTMIYAVQFRYLNSLSNMRTAKFLLNAFRLMAKISKRPIIQIVPLYFLRFRGNTIAGINNTFTVELTSKPKFGFFSVVQSKKIDSSVEERAVNSILLSSSTVDELLIKSIDIFRMYNLATIFNSLPDYMKFIQVKQEKQVVNETNKGSNTEVGAHTRRNPLAKANFNGEIPLPDEFSFENPVTHQINVVETPQAQKPIRKPNSMMTQQQKVIVRESDQAHKLDTDSVSINQVPDLWLSNILMNIKKLNLSQQQYYYIQKSIEVSYRAMKKALLSKQSELMLIFNLPSNIISVSFETNQKLVPLWVVKHLVKESLLIIKASFYLPFIPSLTYTTDVTVKYYNNDFSEEIVFSINRRKRKVAGLPAFEMIVNNVEINPLLSTTLRVEKDKVLISLYMNNKNNNFKLPQNEINYLFSVFSKGVDSIIDTSIPQYLIKKNVNVGNIISASLKTLYDTVLTGKLPNAEYYIEFINNFVEFIKTGDKSKGYISVSVLNNKLSTKTVEMYEQFIYSKLLSNLKL